MSYNVPSGTRIGHVHLKVSDLDKALSFYKDLLGFHITERYGTQAVFLAADDYHHHIGLNTWYSKNAQPAPVHTAGLFPVSYTHLRAHETPEHLVCRLLLEKKKIYSKY